MQMLLACLIITLIFYLFYNYTASTLLYAYSQGHYSNMPPIYRLVNFVQYQVTAINNIFGPNLFNIAICIGGLFGLCMLLLGFGRSSLIKPLLSLVLIAPWWAEVFVLHNPIFFTLLNEYYAYGLGGAAVAALLGLKIAAGRKQNTSALGSELSKLTGNIYMYAGILTAIGALLLLPYIYFSATIYNTTINYANLTNTLGSIPYNATVMTQTNIYPHMYHVLNLELLPNVVENGFIGNGIGPENITLHWINEPEYIVLDFNLQDSSLFLSRGNGGNYTISNTLPLDNYTLVSSYQGLHIYKLK